MRLMMSAVLLVSAFIAPVAAAPSPSYLGRWLIAEVRPAPWYDPANPGTTPFDDNLVGKSVVFTASRIVGPRILACSQPRYRTFAAVPEGLFQGGLTRPTEQAAALGFTTSTIPTLETGCAGGIEFHFADAKTAWFALNNNVYKLVRRSDR